MRREGFLRRLLLLLGSDDDAAEAERQQQAERNRRRGFRDRGGGDIASTLPFWSSKSKGWFPRLLVPFESAAQFVLRGGLKKFGAI